MGRRRERRIRRSESEWFRLVKEFEASGLGQRIFCRRAGISLGSLQRWRKRLPKEAGVGFVELVPETIVPGPQGWSLEIELPNGLTVRWRG